MLKDLKFVLGAVAKKDFLPAMTHFAIENGTVRSYNGALALCAPIAFDIDCKPKALPLVKAIQQCSETIQLAMTPTNKLSIKSGKFKAFVECIAGETIHVMPEGQMIDLNKTSAHSNLSLGEALLAAIKVVEPFIGEDASRPWCTGVLFKGQSVYATNNIIAVEYWTGIHMPIEVSVPAAAVAEMIRIDEAPTYAQVTETSITFHYPDKRWVRSQLLNSKWPDIAKFFEAEHNPKIIEDSIFEGVETIKPFADKSGRIVVDESTHTLRTTFDPLADEGASIELTPLPGGCVESMKGVYQADMLLLLKGVAKTIDFSTFPSPSIFYGDQLRGVIVGMRL